MSEPQYDGLDMDNFYLSEENASLRARLLTLEQALRALTVKWRTEARDEQRVSFCADELEAALAASRGREPERT